MVRDRRQGLRKQDFSGPSLHRNIANRPGGDGKRTRTFKEPESFDAPPLSDSEEDDTQDDEVQDLTDHPERTLQPSPVRTADSSRGRRLTAGFLCGSSDGEDDAPGGRGKMFETNLRGSQPTRASASQGSSQDSTGTKRGRTVTAATRGSAPAAQTKSSEEPGRKRLKTESKSSALENGGISSWNQKKKHSQGYGKGRTIVKPKKQEGRRPKASPPLLKPSVRRSHSTSPSSPLRFHHVPPVPLSRSATPDEKYKTVDHENHDLLDSPAVKIKLPTGKGKDVRDLASTPKKRTGGSARLRQGILRQRKAAVEELETPMTQVPVFQLPSEGQDDDLPQSFAKEDVQDLLDDVDDDFFEDPFSPIRPGVFVCPMCKTQVDEGLLKGFSKGKKRMTIRAQTAFCREHKRRTALETWKELEYPTIDWDQLESRVAEEQDRLASIVSGERESHFESLLAKSVKEGKDRTVLKTSENLVPGYYGPRGFTLISKIINERLRDILREKAVTRAIISSRGSVAYVQTVLVPETAVRLIMEDMVVDEEEARRVMKESVSIGELVHEDVRQVVTERHDCE